MIGRSLAHYRIEAKIGAGGMGEVYRATDTKLGRAVAIKVLPDAWAQNPERLTRFDQEARLLAALNHPNIAAIYGLEEADGIRFLALELVPGDTLAERIAAGPLPVDEAVQICSQIAEALEAAHERGIIHRDLKPANVKVTPDGKVKVLDFGLAKAFETGSGTAVDLSQSPTVSFKESREGMILGTAAYMSPEQARGKPVDKRTDLWALGCVLYETLTGKQVFEGETISDMIGAILRGEPEWEILPGSMPPGVHRVLRRCLQKDSGLRMRDAGDARIELTEAMSGGEEQVAGSATAPASGRTLWKWLLPLIVAGLVSAWGLGRWGGSAPEAVSSGPTRLHMNLDTKIDRSGFAGKRVAISPDGRRIIYVGWSGGTTRLFLRELDSFESVLLPGTERGNTPFFSPDGKSIAFFVVGRLMKLNLSGGRPLTLANVGGLKFGGAWLEDGSIVFCVSALKGPQLITAGGGEHRELEFSIVDEKSPFSCAWPYAIPGTRLVLMTYLGEIEGVPGPYIVAGSLDGGEWRLVTQGSDPRYIPSGHLLYGQGEGLLLAPFDLERLELTGAPISVPLDITIDNWGAVSIDTSLTGTLVQNPTRWSSLGTLVWVGRDGSVTRVVEEQHNYTNPRISPDGKRVALWYGSNAISDVFLLDLERGTSTRLSHSGFNAYPVWIPPDGSRISYFSNFEGQYTPYVTAADGSTAPEMMMKAEAARLLTSYRADGKTGLFYEVNPDTMRDIWRWSSDGEPEPVVVTPYNERAPMLSPDGDWFAYVSNEGGLDEIYVRRYDERGGRYKISIDGGTEPVWAKNGGELFYRSGESLIVVDVNTANGFKAGRPRELFSGSFALDEFGVPNYDVTADGQRFLMVQQAGREFQKLTIVLNWFEELNRLVATGKN